MLSGKLDRGAIPKEGATAINRHFICMQNLMALDLGDLFDLWSLSREELRH